MPERRIPKEIEYPLFGHNTLDSPELLEANQSLVLTNAFPGKSVKPRNAMTEVFKLSGDDGSAYHMDSFRYRPESIGYEHLGKRYLICWLYGFGEYTGMHMLVVHNVTDSNTQYLDMGNFDTEEVHVSFVKLYKGVYVAISRPYSANYTNAYRDISKILSVNNLGVWSVREMGINISPRIQNAFPVDGGGFGLSEGRYFYGGLAFNGKIWVISGINSTVETPLVNYSSDGVFWESSNIKAISLLWSEDGSPLLGEDGTQLYAEATFPARKKAGFCVFGGKMFMLAGQTGLTSYDDIWYSEDGILWVEYGKVAAFGALYGFGITEHAGRLWVVGGFNSSGVAQSTVWVSDDGFTWAAVTQVAGITARGGHRVWSYGGYLWALGGAGTTNIYRTADGATWTQVAANAGMGSRTYFGAVVFDGYMWVVGGLDGATAKNDVYRSTDGVTWTLVQGTAAFAARYGFDIVNFLDEMYLVSGYNGTTIFEDAYHSNDGVTWTSAETGLDSNFYYGYTAIYGRRTDVNAVLQSIAAYVYEPWETYGAQLIVGIDETLLTGTVSLSGTALTGVGTAFLTELEVGDNIRIDGTAANFTLDSISDDDTATVVNTYGASFSGKQFAKMPAVGDPITARIYHPGVGDGEEDVNYRRVVYAQSASDLCRVFLEIPDGAVAEAKGATHLRVYRTLQGSTSSIAQGLAYKWLVDISLGDQRVYRDGTSEAALVGETNTIEVVGKKAPPSGRFCFWAGGRLWIGGNDDRVGYWFASNLPSNTQYPEKYASLFNLETDFITCDPDDGQRDTAGFEFLGDAYFCKERSIYRLSGAKFSNVLTKISYHIGVAFPNSVTFGIDPLTGLPAVYFQSESGPAILTAGGQIRLLIEHKTRELWPVEDSVIIDANGDDTTWSWRNDVHGSFFDDTYWLMYGDSDAHNTPSKVFGCRFSVDGVSRGPMDISIATVNGATVYEPKFLVPFSNTKAYTVSHKSVSNNWQHAIVEFLDKSSFVDTFSQGTASIVVAYSPRLLWVGPYRDSFARADKLVWPVRFNDSAGLLFRLRPDASRYTLEGEYTEQRQSGVSGDTAPVYRRAVTIGIPSGALGSRFAVTVFKTVPSDGDIELFFPEIEVSEVRVPPEFQSGIGSFPALTFVDDANA